MGALLVSLLAWALSTWAWPEMPPISISYVADPLPIYVTNHYSAESHPLPDGGCAINVFPEWVHPTWDSPAQSPGVIAHEVGWCILEQYNVYTMPKWWGVMTDPWYFKDGPNEADRIGFHDIAARYKGLAVTVPGLASD